MMEPLSIPAVTTLQSTDAIAIRQIVSSLIQAIEMLRKDVEQLKSRPVTQTGSKYKGNF
jgi:hypothetical protein